jgi:hypothetical protein
MMLERRDAPEAVAESIRAYAEHNAKADLRIKALEARITNLEYRLICLTDYAYRARCAYEMEYTDGPSYNLKWPPDRAMADLMNALISFGLTEKLAKAERGE